MRQKEIRHAYFSFSFSFLDFLQLVFWVIVLALQKRMCFTEQCQVFKTLQSTNWRMKFKSFHVWLLGRCSIIPTQSGREREPLSPVFCTAEKSISVFIINIVILYCTILYYNNYGSNDASILSNVIYISFTFQWIFWRVVLECNIYFFIIVN